MNLFSISSNIVDKTSKKKKKLRPIVRPKISSAGVVYGSVGSTISRTSFDKSEYNLGEVSKVVDIESYVRQAFGKHTELCLKEGYQLSSRNDIATNYIKKRFKEMAEVSGLTFEMLVRSITNNLITYSNSFVAKVRDIRRSSGQPIMRSLGVPLPPVAAYFPLDPTSIQIKRNYYGKVLKYLQKVPGNPRSPEFIPENMVHLYYDRKEGFAFGTPYIIPVLDDIRSLRRMEENIEMLLNQHLFPLYQYIVGTEDNPAETYDDGTTEVDVIKDQIENMPTEGSIVTPERHDIKNIGAEGKALDATGYLEYFEKRVLAGLGMSEIALGRGGTANRSTATTIDKMMQDRCKDFQDVIESFINEYILKELLYEGGFIIDEQEDNFVKIKFNEIDIDNMLKVENHSVFKYEHDAITETELRELLGKDPVSDEQREDMYFERVAKPKAIILAVDEPYTAEAKSNLSVQKVSKEEKKKREATNREKPANQHGSKSAKTKEKKDEAEEESFDDRLYKEKNMLLFNRLTKSILHVWSLTKQDVMEYITDEQVDKEGDLSNFIPRFDAVLNITKNDIIRDSSHCAIDSFNNGVCMALDSLNIKDWERKDSSLQREVVRDKFNEHINILLEDLKSQLNRFITRFTGGEETIKYNVSSIFDSLRYKVDIISARIIKKSYNFGISIVTERKNPGGK